MADLKPGDRFRYIGEPPEPEVQPGQEVRVLFVGRQLAVLSMFGDEHAVRLVNGQLDPAQWKPLAEARDG